MSYDIDAATAAGHSVDDQLEYLAKLHNYDTNAATTSGHSKEDVLKYLAGLPEPSAKPATKTDTESSIPAAPAGAVIGAATGAMFGPAVGKVVDTGAHTAASVINPAAAPSKNMLMQALTGANESKSPQAVQNWYRTQSSNPFAGGKDYADADIKGKIAAGAPIKSPGNISKKGIRRGYLGINNQLPEETGPQKVASSILNADRTPTSSMIRRVAGGAETVGEFGHMVEEGAHGNYGSAALSGLGVLGGAASQSRNKPIRAIGTAIAAGVPAVQMVLPDDVNKKEGGLIHLASGGQPEMGTAQAYEPSYNERIRDAIAPYIGMQQARGLMGSQGADSESKYNPLSMLAQVPGSLGQNAKDFVHSSSEGDYLGAMGSYLSGAMDAAPLLGGPGKLARLLNYQAGNKAFDKGIDAAEPYIEKGAKAVAPTIAKGIRFIDDVLPKHKSVLAGTHLSPNLYNGQHVQIEGHAVGGKIIEAGADISKKLFDPRFDKRVGEIPKLESLIRHVEPTHNFEAPKIYLPDYEGYPFVTSMSDRSDSNAKLLGLNNTRFNREVDLTGGQGYMFDPRNPGRVWESGKGPSSAILKAARAAKDFTGKDPVYVPWRMAPTGSDFSPMTGETMISYAQSVMGKDDKAAVDNLIKNHIPNWLGMDHPDSFTQFGNQPTATRKAVQKALDKQFRNEGGLGLGEARLAITDPNQANAPEGGLQNIGRIFTDQDLIKSGQKSRYPYGVPGEGIGTLDRDINIAQLLPNWAKERGIEDLTKPGQTDIRALQMKPYSGILTDKILQSAGYKKGGKV